jgi:hypothetical protein
MKSTEHSNCSSSSFHESLLVMSDIPLYRGLMRDNTYNSLAEVDIPVHNVLVPRNCDM